jgi:hypothetical protein
MMKERTAHQRRAELRRRKVAVVAVDWAEVVRYLDTYGYSDYVQVGVFEELVAQGVLQPPWPPFPPGVSDLRDERLPQQQIFPVAGAPVDLGLPESMR